MSASLSTPPTGTQPSGSSWQAREINVTITLGTGSFGQTGMNTVKLTGLRVVATIKKGGFPSLDSASLRVYGVQPQIMNQVSTLGSPFGFARAGNTVLIEAGNSTNGFAVAYFGNMLECYQDFSETPEAFLQINARGGYLAALQPVAATSAAGTADVAQIMSGIAKTMGFAFENNNVQVKVSNPYLPGTAMAQAQELARTAGIMLAFDTSTNPPTLAIWPKMATRGGSIPIISAATGLIGYPKFSSNGLSFRTLYNPNIKLGGQIQMQSSLASGASATTQPSTSTPVVGNPNGLWFVGAGSDGSLVHNLSSQVPGGPWFTDAGCVRVPGVPAAR
jgi:hypothetical protein